MKAPILSLPLTPVYRVRDHMLGIVELWPMDLPCDTPEIYRWVTQPYAHYWGMTNKSYEEVLAEYTAIQQNDHACAWMGKINGKAAFLCECYDPKHDLIGDFYESRPGDIGMHILVGPPETPIHGFTWQVFTIVMDFLFDNPRHKRVVVEPDIRNEKIHRINRKAGFTYEGEVQLSHKTAALAFCTREQYLNTKKNN